MIAGPKYADDRSRRRQACAVATAFVAKHSLEALFSEFQLLDDHMLGVGCQPGVDDVYDALEVACTYVIVAIFVRDLLETRQRQGVVVLIVIVESGQKM